MSTKTRACADQRGPRPIDPDGIPLQARHPGRGDHRRRVRRRQRGPAPPRVRGEGPVRPRDSAAGRAASARLALPRRRRIATPRVPRLQPGAGDAAEGRHAAGAVARHPAAPRHQPRLQVRARRRPRAGARRAARCRKRSRRTARCFPASTPRRCWPARRAATSSRSSAATSPTSRSSSACGGRRSPRSSIRRSCVALSLIVVGDLMLQVVPRVRRLLRTVRARAAAVDADHRRGLELRDVVFRSDRAGGWRSPPSGRGCG